jgi:hypothetical protein
VLAEARGGFKRKEKKEGNPTDQKKVENKRFKTIPVLYYYYYMLARNIVPRGGRVSAFVAIVVVVVVVVETIYAFLVVYTFLVVLDHCRMRFPDLLRNTLHRWFNQTHPYLHANILL